VHSVLTVNVDISKTQKRNFYASDKISHVTNTFNNSNLHRCIGIGSQ